MSGDGAYITVCGFYAVASEAYRFEYLRRFIVSEDGAVKSVKPDKRIVSVRKIEVKQCIGSSVGN